MVAPITTLQVVQAGIEGTRGTLVPATRVVDFTEANLSRDPSINHIRQGGSLSTSHRAFPGHDVVEVTLKGRFTYDWAPWWFNLFLGPLGTPTGAGADKTWTFGTAVISDISDNLKSASLEVGGKDTWPSEFKIAGCVGRKLHLAMNLDGAWEYEATILGGAVTKATKTGAIVPLTSISDILGQNTKVYLNGTGSAFGTTQKTGVVLSAEIDIEIGMTQRFTLDGSRSATRTAITQPRNITGKLVAEWDAITDYDALFAQTAQRLRIEATGASLGGSNYKATIDVPGMFDTLDFADDGGVITEEIAFTAQYDSTAAADIGAVIVNAGTALP